MIKNNKIIDDIINKLNEEINIKNGIYNSLGNFDNINKEIVIIDEAYIDKHFFKNLFPVQIQKF